MSDHDANCVGLFSAMSEDEKTELVDHLEAMPPEEMLKWAAERYKDRAAILTSFQDTGCVTIDLACRAGADLRVVTIDTLRLHKETYELMDRMEAHYGIGIERFCPEPDRLRQMVESHGEYLFFNSKEKQEYCCHIRKVEPNRRALATLDVWITGLRRDQSREREDARRASLQSHEDKMILKLAPLADWDSARVWAYINDHGLPYNALYDQSYSSIGCEICSTPTMPWEDPREGRWRWQREPGSRECGIHLDGSGI